jgi:type VI secretion system protein
MTHGGPGLFEAVTGHFANGDPIGIHKQNQQTFLSVRDNIQRILNSRRNSLAHLPDYGLGDLSKIYRHMPASAHTLSKRA